MLCLSASTACDDVVTKFHAPHRGQCFHSRALRQIFATWLRHQVLPIACNDLGNDVWIHLSRIYPRVNWILYVSWHGQPLAVGIKHIKSKVVEAIGCSDDWMQGWSRQHCFAKKCLNNLPWIVPLTVISKSIHHQWKKSTAPQQLPPPAVRILLNIRVYHLV